MQEIIDGFQDELGPYLPRLIGALAILIIGWIVAAIVARVVRRILHRVGVDRRLAKIITGKEEGGGAENAIASAVYWLIMLLVLVAALESLALRTVTEPLNQALQEIFLYLPRIIAGAIILVIAWIVARVVRTLLSRAFDAFGLDDRVGAEAGGDVETEGVSGSLAEAGYWLVFLLFLPALLAALQVGGLVEPAQGMVDTMMGFVPNLIAAAFILGIGWFVASLIRRIVTNLARSAGLDRVGERAGITSDDEGRRLSGLLGLVIYALILIPVLVAALDALELQNIATPTSNMLDRMLEAVPNVIGAGLILVIAYIVGRIVGQVVTSILEGLNFDSVPERMGLNPDLTVAGRSPSVAGGGLVLVAIMVFAALEAVNLLGFDQLAVIVSDFTTFSGEILLGILIIGIGLFLANLAGNAIQSSDTAGANLLALIARVMIVVFAGAIGLREMGIANEIVILAFGVPLTAAALAAAIAVGIAVGIGGRDVAAEEVTSIRDSLRSGRDQ